jgi:hypothetical protein
VSEKAPFFTPGGKTQLTPNDRFFPSETPNGQRDDFFFKDDFGITLYRSKKSVIVSLSY